MNEFSVECVLFRMCSLLYYTHTIYTIVRQSTDGTVRVLDDNISIGNNIYYISIGNNIYYIDRQSTDGTVRVLDDNTYMAKETYQYGKRDLPARQKRDGTVGVLDENKMNEFSVECVLFWCTV